MAISKEQLTVSVVLDSSGAVKGIHDLEGRFLGFDKLTDKLTKSTKKNTDETNKLGTAFKGLAAGFSKAAIPIVAINQGFEALSNAIGLVQRAMSATVGSAIDLELQVARINTVIEDSERGQVDFAKKILEMQATFGSNPTEAAKGFYEAIASGATNAAGSVALMNTAQKLAIGGLLPLDKALSGLTTGIAAYGYTAEESMYLSDAFFIAAAKGKTDVEELTTEIGKVTSIAEQAGVSFAEMLSGVSAVTLGGKSTAEAATSMKSAITALLNPTEELQYVLDQLGIKSVVAAIEQRGLADVYKDVYGYVGNNAEALTRLVGRVESLSAIVAMTSGKQAQSYKEMVAEITDSNRKMGESTDRAMKIIGESSSYNLDVAKGKIIASFTDISQTLMKVIVPIATGLATALDAVLRPIVLITDALDEFASKVSDWVIPAVASLTAIFLGFKVASLPVIGALVVSMKALIVPVTLIAAKFLAISAAIGAVVIAADLLIRNFKLLGTIGELVGAKIAQGLLVMVSKIEDGIIWLIEKAASIGKSFGLDFDVSGMTQKSEALRADLERVGNVAQEAGDKIAESFDIGALGVLIDYTKKIPDLFKDAGDAAQEIQGPPAPKERASKGKGGGVDVKKLMEERRKMQDELNGILSRTQGIEDGIVLSQYHGFDAQRKALELEFQNIDALVEKLKLTKGITAEQLAGVEKYKAAATKALEIDIKTEKIQMATDLIGSAASGADAVVGNAINQLGKAFGPEGQMIAGAVNLLRQGGEAMKELGQGLIKVIIELPLMLAEGIVGLVEGLLQGVIDMLADPARLAKITMSLIAMIPKLITTIAKALPSLLKMLLDPMFWIEFASQIVRSLWDALVEMFSAIGDLFGSIFSGDIFGGMEESTEEMGRTVDAGIRYATNALTGISDEMFGVMEDTAMQAQAGQASKRGEGGQAAKKKEASWFTKYIVEPLARVVNFLWEGLSGIGEYIWGVIEPVINVIGTTLVAAIRIAIEIFSTAFDIIWTTAKTVWNTMVAYLKGTWNVMMSVFKTVWNVGVALFKGVVNIFKTVFEAIANVLRGVWDFAKSIFDGIINTFKALWDFVKGIFDDPIAAFQKLWDDLKNIVSDLWDSITELGTVLWDAIKSIGKAIWDALARVGEAMWEGIKSIGSKIWEMFKGVGGAIWEGTKDIGKRIGESLSNVGDYLWDGIKGAFSGIKNFFKNLFSFDGGGRGAVEKFLNFDFPWIAFAEGGKVPGTPNVFGDSTKNDTVAALLSPGEFVIPRSKMQDPDNLMLVDMIMSGGAMKEWILNGATKGVQAKSYGSWIEKAQSGGIEFHSVLSDLAEAVTPQWILDLWDSIKKFVSNISLKDLISDPIGAIEKAIKGTLDFLVEPFKKMMGFNLGGMVPGYGTSDTIPAMLTPGEFVINRDAAQALGAPLLNRLNAGMAPSASGASQAPTFNITLNIETREAIDDNYVRQKLIPTIKQEIRSSSLRGEFLISSKGVRK